MKTNNVSVYIIRIAILLNISCAITYPAFSFDYFTAQGNETGCISVNPVSGNIAVSDDTGISIYSNLDFSLLHSFIIPGSNCYITFSENGFLLFTCIDDDIFDYPNEPGRFSVIDLSTLSYQIVQIDRYPNNIYYGLDGNIYLAGGYLPGVGGKIFKYNLNTNTMLNELPVGDKPELVLSSDETKIYVLDDFMYKDYADNPPEVVDDYCKVWIINTLDLAKIGEIKIEYEGNEIIRNDDNMIVISHDPSPTGWFPSLTVIDSTSDQIEKEIKFDNIGFIELAYNPTNCLLYGAITIQQYDEYGTASGFESHTQTGVVDLESETISFIGFESEKVGPLTFSPDYSRLYVKSLQSNKVYYVDL